MEYLSTDNTLACIENERKQPEKHDQKKKQSILGRIKQEQAKSNQKPPEQDGKVKTKSKGTML